MTDHILIVENSAPQAKLLKLLLETNGYAVTVTANGQAGLVAAAEIKPNLIISDITMPVMDGYQMCRAIKDDPSMAEIPVMLLTSLADASDILRGLQAGTDYYLTKPYEDRHMLDRIGAILAADSNGLDMGATGELILKTASQSPSVYARQKQILTLLLSTYESAVAQNQKLFNAQQELEILNEELDQRVRDRTKQLADSEYRYRALFEQAADSVVLIDPHSGVLVEFNDKAHENLGYTREEFSEIRISDVEILETPEEVNEHIAKILSVGSDVFETKHRTKGGESRDILVSSRAISLKGQDFVQSIWTDITEPKRAEAHLAVKNDQLEEALLFARQNAEIAQALGDSAGAINSTLNLDDVLDRILADVGRVVPHDAADIMLIDETEDGTLVARIVRGRGYTESGQQGAVVGMRLVLNGFPHMRAMVETGKPNVVADTEDDSAWQPLPETTWIQSWAAAPLRIEDETIGFLNVSSKQTRHFTQDHAERLQAFADQAAVAIQNARLYSHAQQEIAERARAEEEIQIRSEHLALLNTINEAINRAESLPKIIEFIAEQTKQAFSGLGANVSLLSEDKTELEVWNLALPPGILTRVARAMNLSPSLAVIKSDAIAAFREVLQDHRPLLVTDAGDIALHRDELANALPLPSERGRKVFRTIFRKAFTSAEVEAMLFAPLLAGDEAIGVIAVTSRKRLSTEDLGRLNDIAGQLTTAIVRKQEEFALRESEEKFRTLADKSPNMIFINQGGRVIYANEACTATMGFSLKEFYAAEFDFRNLIAPESRNLVEASFARHMHGDEVAPIEYRLLAKDGSHIDAIHTTRLIQYGGAMAILGILTNVTDRKQAERALRRSLEETAHGQRQLLALSEAGQAVQRARSAEEIYSTMGDEVARLGYEVLILMLADDRKQMVIRFMSLDTSLLEADTKLTGLSPIDHQFLLAPGGLFDRVIAKEQTLLIEPASEAIAESLPKRARPLAGRLASMMGLEQAICAPMRKADEVDGILMVTGSNLTEADIPAVTTFANQAGIALENARLHAIAQAWVAELEQRVEQRTAELTTSQARYQTLFDSAHDGLYVFDMQGRYIDANPAARQLLGYTREELLELDLFRAVVEWRDLPLDQRDQHLKRRQEQWSKGLDAFETELIAKSGEKISVEVALAPIAYQGREAVLAAVRDIRQRKREEGEVKRIYDLSIDMLGIATFDGYFTRLNPAWEKTLGFSPDELMAQPYIEFIHPDDREATLAEAQKLTTGALTISFENRYRSKDGSYKWISWNVIPYEGEQLLYFVARDITERKRVEQAIREKSDELLAANKELESFSYSVSHDLRAPLRAMDGFSRILMEEHLSELSDEGQGYLQRVRDNAKQMGQLVDELLAFSRLGRAELRKRPLAPADLVHQVLTELTADEKNGHAEVSIDELPECYGDPALLKQVYANLLSNALKFTNKRDDARIEVGFDRVTGEGAYFVRDNGAGFDMAYADKLFGVFQRLHGPEDFEGTGVGLAIVQRVIQRHGGRIWAEAEVDKGATFYFTLEDGNRDV